jgi:putative transposase
MTIERMCYVAGVSRASYYRHWEESAPRQQNTELRECIQRLALQDRHQGYRRITKRLQQQGWVVNHKRVLRLMREDNLLCLRKRAFVPPTTDSGHHWRVWPNLARGLHTTGPHQLWVADITYVRLKEEFVYVAVVLDAHSRRVIGWAVESHLATTLAMDALNMAIMRRQPEPGLIHHSDRGVQYACGEYVQILMNHEIQISMSRTGNPYDNAKAESFMATLKREQIHGEEFSDIADLRRKLHRFFDRVYNETRLHSALGYKSPAQFERDLAVVTVRK